MRSGTLMKMLLGILFLCPGFLLFSYASVLRVHGAEVLRVTDDSGQTVELPHPARRVIPLYGAFAEMLYAIGAGDSVAARTQADRFPPDLLRLPSVGTHMKPNVEMILGLKPDLVIQSSSRREAIPEIRRIQAAGIPMVVFDPKNFQQIFSTMIKMGVLTGKEGSAREAVEQLEGRLKKAGIRLEGSTRELRMFYEVRGEPLTAAGQGSIIQEILVAAGAKNVVSSPKALVQYSVEALLVDDPDVYIVQRGPMNRNPAPPDRRQHFSRLRCVREGRVLFVDEFIFSRPGPRCVDAVEQLAEKLRPYGKSS